MSYEELWEDREQLEREQTERAISTDQLRSAEATVWCGVTTVPDIEVASGANAGLTTEFTPLDYLMDRLTEFVLQGWTTPPDLSEVLRHILSTGDQYDADWLTRMADFADAMHPDTLILLHDQPSGSFRRRFEPRSPRNAERPPFVSAVKHQEIRPDGPSIDELLEQLLREGHL